MMYEQKSFAKIPLLGCISLFDFIFPDEGGLDSIFFIDHFDILQGEKIFLTFHRQNPSIFISVILQNIYNRPE